MMAFANTEDPWIDYLIISRLGGYYATPIVHFFQDGRFIIISRLGGYYATMLRVPPMEVERYKHRQQASASNPSIFWINP
jgi:predicted esterase YcpF (UPF0227 family)